MNDSSHKKGEIKKKKWCGFLWNGGEMVEGMFSRVWPNQPRKTALVRKMASLSMAGLFLSGGDGAAAALFMLL